MFKIIAVSNRGLCAGDFLLQLEAVAASGVSAIMLREKDLSPAAYEKLAAQAAAICKRHGTEFIPHQFSEAARNLGCDTLHLPFSAFTQGAGLEGTGITLGVSVHSLEEARCAVSRGAGYLVAGNVFQTDCKSGLEGRGLSFLAEICARVPVPVYGIGGISEQHIRALREAGAAGACLMSSFMRCADPAAYTERLLRALRPR